jgi:hypothetical protein
MKRIVFGFLITCLVLQLLILPASAQPVTGDDARNVAQNWVTMTIRQQGNWGGSQTAQIGEIRQFKRGDRVIGYFCPVSPKGFLVISLRRELAPVKAYSDTSNLDPDSDQGMTDLIKLQMAAILDEIEQKAGPVATVSSANVTRIMEFNYLGSWDVLDTGAPAFQSQLQSGLVASNYQQGGVLLTTRWDQDEPYDYQIPAPPQGSSCNDPHCDVGCGAVAEGQVMRYWSWPPYLDPAQRYHWPLMVNQIQFCTQHFQWEDENGNPLTQDHVDEVAGFLHDVGMRDGTKYCDGGCGSSANIFDMLDSLENNFRYNNAGSVERRNQYTPASWFSLFKQNINENRPIPYHVKDHFIVGDGWNEFYLGPAFVQMYHMNYGGGLGAQNAWYLPESLPNGGIDEEMMMDRVYPAPSLGNALSGTYLLQAFPYRYFDQDAYGNSASFSSGQNLQFLPGIKATCNSGTGTSIRFDGTGSLNTRLFTRGDTSKGVIIRSGTIKLNPGGSVKLP